MIKKARLKNWRSHLESEFEFSTGTNALLGSMGSGKSSCMDAICFGLFGTFPTLQSKKLRLDNIIMKKPIEKNRAEVEVFFQVDGKEYSVRRVIDRGKGTTYSEIREGGNLIEAPNSQRVTEVVEKTLRANYELFSKAVYSEQNALDYFLTIPKGQRMKKIDELLMIDKFETARASGVSLTNKLTERKLGKQSILDQIDTVELEKTVSGLKDSLNQLLSQKGKLSKVLGEVSGEKSKLDETIEELKKIKEDFELLKREEQGICSAIEETKSSFKPLEERLKEKTKEDIEKKLKELREKSEGLEETFKEKQENYEKLSSSESEARAKIDFLKNEKIEKLEKEFKEKQRVKKEFIHLKNLIGEDITKQLDENKNLYERLIGEVQELKVKIKDLKNAVQQLSSLEGKCPICESKLTEEKKNLLSKQKNQQIRTLKKRLGEVSERKELVEKELQQIEDSAKKLDEMLIQIKDFDAIKTDLESSKNLLIGLNEYVDNVGSQLSKLKKEIEAIGDQLKKTVEERQEFEILFLKRKDFEEKKSRFDELLKERKNIEAEIKKIEQKISGEDLMQLENRLKTLIAKEKEVETTMVGFEQLIRERDGRVREYEFRLSEAGKQKEEVQKLDKIIKDLKIFEKALQQTQVELRTEFIEAVNYTMNKLWNTLYPYQDFSGIRLSTEEGDYVLQLKERSGLWVNVEGVASGGERSIACLALRIALALVLAPNLQILVLDEPTANLDRNAIKELAATLRGRINEFIGQTFLITHQAELENAVTGSLYKLERNKERDGITKVINSI